MQHEVDAVEATEAELLRQRAGDGGGLGEGRRRSVEGEHVAGIAEPRGDLALLSPAERQRTAAIGHEGEGGARPLDERLEHLPAGERPAVPEPHPVAAPAPLRLPQPATAPGKRLAPSAEGRHSEAAAPEKGEDHPGIAHSREDRRGVAPEGPPGRQGRDDLGMVLQPAHVGERVGGDVPRQLQDPRRRVWPAARPQGHVRADALAVEVSEVVDRHRLVTRPAGRLRDRPRREPRDQDSHAVPKWRRTAAPPARWR